MRQNHSGADTFSQDFFADLRIGALKDLYEKSKDELVEYNLYSQKVRQAQNSPENNDNDSTLQMEQHLIYLKARLLSLEWTISTHIETLLKHSDDYQIQKYKYKI